MQATVVITGANRGIGLALTQHYVSLGAKVIAICRSVSEQLEMLNVEVIDSIDITLSSDITKLKQALADQKIDILINNAGILTDESLGDLNFEQIITQFNVNTLGPLRVVDALLDNLRSGSKIALITSRMGSIEDNTSGGRYGYRLSKCALNAVGQSLAVDLKAKGIAVALLHPGYVKTQMVNFAGLISAEFSAQGLAQRIDELNLENSGTFWHSNGEVLPW